VSRLAYSFSIEESETKIPHTFNKHWIKKFDDDHYLITTEHGAWVVLSRKEFDLFRADRLDQDLNLFRILEKKGVIITEGNFEKIAVMYRTRFNRIFKGTNLHIITPTLRCNQKCLYCYPHARHEKTQGFDMDRRTAKATVDFIFQSPSPFITIEIQGGEPLLNFKTVKFIIEYAKKKNGSSEADEGGWWNGKKRLAFQMVSNLTMMDLDKFQFIMDNSIRLCTSLDGPQFIHDKNRPWSEGSSYEKVVYWIDQIQNEIQYKFFTGAMPTITKLSLAYPEKIVDEYRKLGLNHISMRPIFIAGTAEMTWNIIGYTPQEFFDFWKKYLHYILELNKRGENFVGEDVMILLRRIVTIEPSMYTCLGAPCGACITQAGYNQWGDIFTCDEGRNNEIFKLGNVKKNTYKEVFTSKQALNFIGLTSTIQDDPSPWHPYSSPCHVSTYGQQKNLISKTPMDYLLQIHNMQIEYLFQRLIFSEGDRKILSSWVTNYPV